jgi:hypothetical protein
MSGPWEKYRQPSSDGPWSKYAQSAPAQAAFDPRTFAAEEAQRQGVDPDLVTRVIQQESSWKPDARSKAGAIGYMQLMPGTAKDMGVDPSDPKQNIIGGIKYLKKQLDDFGAIDLALAAYNAGPGTVRKLGNRVPNYPETIAYIEKITGKKSGPTGDDSYDPAPVPDASAGAGFVRGVGGIAANISNAGNYPARLIRRGLGMEEGDLYNDPGKIDTFLQEKVGADPARVDYQGGKLIGEVATTWRVPGMLGKTAKALPFVDDATAAAISSGGLNVLGQQGANALAKRAVGGALSGGVSAGVVDPENVLMGAAIGGGLPIIAKGASTAGRAIGGAVSGNLSAERVALAKRAAELGIDLPADKIADSKPMNALASSLNYVPFSGRAATEGRVYGQVKRAVSRTFGQDSENVTQALRTARQQLGGEFDRVLTSYPVKMDQALLDDLTRVLGEAGSELGDDAFRVVTKQAETLFDKASGGVIDGKAAYAVKKALDRIGNSGDSSKAYHAGELKKALMAALNRSLPPEEAAKFAEIRKMYGNMLDIERVALSGADGNVSVAKLANMKNINNKDLQELADIATDFLKARESPHGAAQRVFLGGLASGAGMFEPATLAVTAAGVGAGRTANALLDSGPAKNYVLKGAASNQGEINNALAKYLPLIYQSPQLR